MLAKDEALYFIYKEHATIGPHDSSTSFIVPHHLVAKMYITRIGR